MPIAYSGCSRTRACLTSTTRRYALQQYDNAATRRRKAEPYLVNIFRRKRFSV